jgi:hypothetical protein
LQFHKGLARVFQNPGPAKAPWQLKVAVNIPGVHDLLGRVVGVGVRLEHIAGAGTRPACNVGSLKKVAVGIGLGRRRRHACVPHVQEQEAAGAFAGVVGFQL